MLQSQDIRQRFLAFFEKRGHAILSSSSLVPENDPSVLFNTAGMQPLVPYLLGMTHPQGKRLADVQKCVRTVDIEEIGDNTHLTFFEMLGNWSLGDYFKEEAIQWSYEFLTSREEGLGLDPSRLYVTVFEGDENAPKDTEAFEIWKRYVPENRIYFMGAKSNWWSPGENGPCGPDTEMFYDVTEHGLGDMTREEYLAADERQDVVEIWNDVFMEYEKKDGKVIGKLEKRNVDTGSGLERVTMVVQGKSHVFDTDAFSDIFARLNEAGLQPSSTQEERERARRIIADHTRTAVFLIADGVRPSNIDQGYVLRRLIRRGVRYAHKYCTQEDIIPSLTETVVQKYKHAYPSLTEQAAIIRQVLSDEQAKFLKALSRGEKEVDKRLSQTGTLSGKDAFELFTTYGFPFEMTCEIAEEKGILLQVDEFREEFKKHQDLSRTASAGKFKGGLADHSSMAIKYHTATHLLQQALREVLGYHVLQKGSNITAERLRFDFSHPEKMTPEEIQRTEEKVNEKIKECLAVTYEDLPLEEAKKRGAIGLFEEKYGDKVRVYKIGDFSLEFCGGPHVNNTAELGYFKIIKEEASSAGVRRIKAILQ